MAVWNFGWCWCKEAVDALLCLTANTLQKHLTLFYVYDLLHSHKTNNNKNKPCLPSLLIGALNLSSHLSNRSAVTHAFLVEWDKKVSLFWTFGADYDVWKHKPNLLIRPVSHICSSPHTFNSYMMVMTMIKSPYCWGITEGGHAWGHGPASVKAGRATLMSVIWVTNDLIWHVCSHN